MTELSDQKCEPCQGGVDPLEGDEIEPYIEQLGDDWEVVDEHHLQRKFEFEDFQEALDFVNCVGEVAEEQGHHPNIEFTWGEATIKIYTHKIDGLHENDFILASKIDGLYSD